MQLSAEHSGKLSTHRTHSLLPSSRGKHAQQGYRLSKIHCIHVIVKYYLYILANLWAFELGTNKWAIGFNVDKLDGVLTLLSIPCSLHRTNFIRGRVYSYVQTAKRTLIAIFICFIISICKWRHWFLFVSEDIDVHLHLIFTRFFSKGKQVAIL